MDQTLPGGGATGDRGTIERLVRLLREGAERIRQLEAEKQALGDGRPAAPVAAPLPEPVQQLLRRFSEDARRIEHLESDNRDLRARLASAEEADRALRARLAAAEHAALHLQALLDGTALHAAAAEERSARAEQCAIAAEARAQQAERRVKNLESELEWNRLAYAEAAIGTIAPLAA